MADPETTAPARGFLDRNGDPTTREALIAEQETDRQKENTSGQTTVCQHCGGTHSLPIPEGNLLRDRHGWTALVCPWCDHKEIYCAEDAETHG